MLRLVAFVECHLHKETHALHDAFCIPLLFLPDTLCLSFTLGKYPQTWDL